MITALATLAAIVLGLPLVVLGIECWLSLLPLRKHALRSGADPRLVVVIPAHDEADFIAAAVERLRRHLDDTVEIIVIADNCQDDTANRARAAGATAWERDDPSRLGKGFALNFAWQRLRQRALDVVVYIDSDCFPAPECVQTIARVSHQLQRPVQAAYTMQAPLASGGLGSISALAVFVKNYVRPRGLQRLGLPCLLTGSGMAIPANVLAAVPFPDGHVSEDYRISTDLAIAGFAAEPCMEARVWAQLPDQRSSFMTQRTRWEHGHLQTILTEAPRLLVATVRNRSFQPLALCLDLIVPPLSLMLLGSLVLIIAFIAVGPLIGLWQPLVAYLTTVAIGATGLIAAWLVRAQAILPFRTAWRIPKYVAVKAPIYLRFLHHRQNTWVRTERSPTLADSSEGGAPTPAPPELSPSKRASVHVD